MQNNPLNNSDFGEVSEIAEFGVVNNNEINRLRFNISFKSIF
jgi:hypothetical protein